MNCHVNWSLKATVKLANSVSPFKSNQVKRTLKNGLENDKIVFHKEKLIAIVCKYTHFIILKTCFPQQEFDLGELANLILYAAQYLEFKLQKQNKINL